MRCRRLSPNKCGPNDRIQQYHGPLKLHCPSCPTIVHSYLHLHNIIQCICSECHLIYLAICKSKFSITLEMILTKAVGIKKGYDTTKDPFCFHGQLIDTFTKSLFTILQLAQQTITSNSKQHILKEVPEI